MDVTLFLPELAHPAIEERYASWHSEYLLRRDAPAAAVRRYPSGRSLDLSGVDTKYVAVLTNPLSVIAPGALPRLVAHVEREPAASAAVPAANNGGIQQATLPRLYLTLRQFEEVAEEISSTPATRVERWSGGDPALFVARRDAIQHREVPAASLIDGLATIVAHDAYLHQFASQRGQLRADLLARIDPSAKRILEFGCGEASLGGALKERQSCRVVGVELDPDAAAVAAQRIDRVVRADVRQVVAELGEQFDSIIGGDIVEHLDDPWTFLAELRSVAAPGARLLLSLPNISHWSIVADLLQGRFDYVYIGLLCAGHLRFFTRRSIEQMVTMAGWTLQQIESQEPFTTDEFRELAGKLQASGIAHSIDDLTAPGYYVTAVNRQPGG